MSIQPIPRDDRPDDRLAPDDLERIIVACDRFEAAWKSGPRPSIEAELATVPDRLRPRLFQELLALELELRRGGGEEPSAEDYLARFTDDRDAVARLLSRTEDAGVEGRPRLDRPGRASRPEGAERDLLFGLLALQNGFIDRAALLAAFNAWLADKARPLGEILVGNGALAREAHEALQILVAAHVRDHSDDPRRSLAAIGSPDPVRRDLERLDDPDLQASLTVVGADRTTAGADDDDTVTYRPGVGRDASERFRTLRFHARGGLGEVSVALDTELNREVALKRILGHRADADADRRRFVFEAEVTGGLEHPGIVPVYSLGRDPDSGRPYYAMRFIRGDSLKDAIAAYHADEARRADPSDRSLQLRRLLSQLIDACNAIAYAQSRGVLHRDIKPSNIMVGKYGETLVVDWGLAKVLGRPDEPSSSRDEAMLRPPSGGDLRQTLPGSAIGTPQYMPPEQAEGRLDLLGPHSDVYSLGATLYTILVGRPPFPQKTVPEVLAAVRRGDFTPPRTVDASIPHALDAICLKAMALRPEDRYDTATALAEDLEHWLADEPVSAWREPLAVRARRWANRHQRLVSGAAATLLMGLVTLAALAVVITASNRRLDLANTELSQANADLDAARSEAVAERDRAEAVTDFLVESFRSPDPARDGRTITIAEVLDRAVENLSQRDDLAPTTRAEILNAIGTSYGGLGLVNEAVDVCDEALRLVVREFGADHPYTPTLRHELAFAYHAVGRLEEAIALYEQTLEARRAKLGDDHPETLIVQQNLATSYEAAGRLDEALALYERTLKIRRAKLGENHRDTLKSQSDLANFYRPAGRLDKAISLLERTLEATREALGHDHPDTLGVLNNLAQTYHAAGRLDKAIPRFEQALEATREVLGHDHPDTLIVQQNLAYAYKSAERLDEAIPLYEQALETSRAKLGGNHSSTLILRNNLARAYQAVGRLEDAVPMLEQASEVSREALGGEHPLTLSIQNNLAIAYKSTNRPDKAIDLLERTLEIRRAKLGHDHPETLQSLSNLAVAYEHAGRLKDAIPMYERVTRGVEMTLGDLHPQAQFVRRNLIRAYERAERHEDAGRVHRDLVAAAGRRDPRDDAEYAEALAGLGEHLIRRGDFAEAEAALRESLELREIGGPDAWTTANTRGLLGEALAGLGRLEEAETLLLNAHREITERAEAIPEADRDDRLRAAVERLVRLYETWGETEEAARWRRERAALRAEPTLPDNLFAPPAPESERSSQEVQEPVDQSRCE